MKLKKAWLDNIILMAGAVTLISILLLPKFNGAPVYYPESLEYASTTLKGQIPFSDFATTVVGFRALYNKTDPYPVLGPALKSLGIDWNVVHGSTHPPTSYLLAAPIAFFPWPVASALWAWLMLCLIVFSYRLYGLSWRMSLGLMPLTLLWPPASASLGQLTIVWMFGLAVGYYFKGKRLFWSGAGVGLASILKLVPALMMTIFLAKRKWTAILGFIFVWVLSLSLVTILNPSAVPRYLEEQLVTKRIYDLSDPAAVPVTTPSIVMQRTDNSAPLLVSYRYGGWVGVALIVLLFSLIIFANRGYFFEWRSTPSTRVWMLCSYFAVACLPIFWLYSLLPLLPVIAYLFFELKIVSMVISVYSLLISSIYIWGGEQSALPIASISIMIGLAFILDRLPFKVFQKRWGGSILLADKATSTSES
jgi:hypothetical protein